MRPSDVTCPNRRQARAHNSALFQRIERGSRREPRKETKNITREKNGRSNASSRGLGKRDGRKEWRGISSTMKLDPDTVF